MQRAASMLESVFVARRQRAAKGVGLSLGSYYERVAASLTDEARVVGGE
jgi:hypothetical protein